MKWYFCINRNGLSGLGEPLLAAVHSCLENTQLEPNLIFDGRPNELTEYLEHIGVKVHFHKVSFANQIQAAKQQDGYRPEVAEGAYLRYDIPLIDTSDDIVLYTDVDVVFTKNPDFNISPHILAAAPEYALNVTPPQAVSTVFNSGVMVLNLATFRKELPALIDFSREHNFYFHGVGGYYDQGALNRFFEGRWQQLSQSCNWRPFSPAPGSPTILHFHGTKPYEIAQLVLGQVPDREVASKLFSLNRANYFYAFGLYARYLTPMSQVALEVAAPDAIMSYSFVKFLR